METQQIERTLNALQRTPHIEARSALFAEK